MCCLKSLVIELFILRLKYVSGFEKREHFALKVDFELVVSVALCCASIAALVPELRSLKVQKYARCNYEETAHSPPVTVSVNMATA